MPVIQNCKFDGDVTPSTSLHTRSTLLDLFAKIKRPFRVCAGRVQDGGDIVVKDDSGEEANVDVTSNLEDVVVLPRVHVSYYVVVFSTTRLTTSARLRRDYPMAYTCHLR
jgi:hypothetical protein